MRTELLLAAVSLYAVAISYTHYIATRPLNPLCARDFVEPTESGTCLCGENQYCLCTPSLAADT